MLLLALPLALAPQDTALLAYVDALSPPSLERVLAELGPEPTLDELFALAPPEAPAPRPAIEPTPAEREALSAGELAALLASLTAGQVDVASTTGAEAALEQAWAHVQLVARLAPDNVALDVDAHYRLARVFLVRRDARRSTAVALEAWQRGATLPRSHPALGDVLLHLYRVRYRAHDPAMAARFAAAALTNQIPSYGRDQTSCTALASLATCAYQRGRPYDAVRLYEEVATWRKLVAPSLNAVVERSNLAKLYFSLGEWHRAEPVFLDAIAIGEALDGPRNRAVLDAKCSLAELLHYLGDEDGRAIPLAREAMQLLEDEYGPNDDRSRVAKLTLAGLLRRRGDALECVDLASAVLERQSALGQDLHWNSARALGILAAAAVDSGRKEEAVDLARRALAVQSKISPPGHIEIAHKHLLLGEILSGSNHYAEGVVHLRLAEQLRARSYPANSEPLATSRCLLGQALYWLNEHEEAKRTAEDALAALGEDPEWTSAYGGLLSVLARAQHALGELTEAEASARRSIEVRTAVLGAAHPTLLHIQRTLALTLHDQGRTEEAAECYRAGLEAGARWRAHGIGRTDARARAGVTHARVARELAHVLVLLRRPREAFDASEIARGRVLLDLLQEGGFDRATAAGAVAAEDESRTTLLLAEDQLRLLRTRPGLAVEERAERVAAQQAVVREANDALREAERRVLALQALAWPDAKPTTSAVLEAALEPGELVLSYNWTGFGLTVVALERGAPCEAGQLGDGPLRMVATVRDALRVPAVDAEAAEQRRLQLASLGAGLIPPRLLERVRAAKRIVVLPDGTLIDVPFEALVVDGAPLLDLVDEVVVAPSASVYLDRRRAQRADDDARAVVVGGVAFGDGTPRAGDPPQQASALERLRLFGGALEPLPGTEEEIARLVRAFTSRGLAVRTLAGSEATVSALEASLGNVGYLHIATHGLPGTAERPFDAALAFAPPQRLTADDIGFLTLDHLLRRWDDRLAGCELVVLSACDSTRSSWVGSTSMTLPWGFFHAGARSVLASQWRVDDQAAALLMARFYDNLLGTHPGVRVVGDARYGPGVVMPKASALTEAKRWLRTATRRDVRAALRGGGEPVEGATLSPYGDPYFWAGFVLLGAPD